ncbi:ABC transporter substrate-binding protein [Paenibacillus radicis (ex Gao et al. 2016)]|uniref:Sugar ABC transporter substrate-binding protein n=1 Tax=Paenibacillus radicis (ex Gao et al. 2016) TaxID=1737354 RepID=A0A917M506_9BACL|nr:extracellular solute-binding protein [Paenibacillus radicis (ex Gao et al. 2016)]GGG78282.1 sugar ABC transporter substrate-binding protein [Paenibacillus radicis (ex Gao et al. 2016)]
MKKTGSKATTVLLVLVAVMVFMAGCGGSNGTGGNNKGENKSKGKEITLRVATSFAGSDPWVPAWTNALQQFKDKHPNVKIVDESTPVNNEALRTKVKADAATGNLADVMFYFNGSETAILTESGEIVSWEDELAKDPEWAKQFNSGIMDKVKYNGKLYALPYIGFYEGLFWNKTLFDKYQLEAPATYDAFMKAVDTFAANDIIPFATSLTTPYLQEALVLSQVGPEGQQKAYDASWAPALNIFRELSEKKAFPKDALTLDDEKAQALFSGGKAAMMFNGSWTAAGNSKIEGIEILPFPLVPGGKGENMIVSGFGSGWYMKNNKDQDKYAMALEFIKFITSPEVAGKFAEIGGTYAVQATATNETAKLLTDGNAMVAAAKDFVMPIDSYVTRESYTEFTKGLAYLSGGKKTAEEVLAEAKKLNDKATK